MDADNLDKLDAVIGAMTPGPWEADDYGSVGPLVYIEHDADYGRAPEKRVAADIEGIATLRNVAPELLAVARAVTDSDTIAALMLSDHPHASDCARALVAALDALRAKTAEVLP